MVKRQAADEAYERRDSRNELKAMRLLANNQRGGLSCLYL
jgi:hypothetical protein